MPSSLSDFISTIWDVEANWIGLAETHIDSTSKRHVQEKVRSVVNSFRCSPHETAASLQAI